MVTDYEGYKKNTISLDDFLVYMKFGKDFGGAILDANLKSIKENVQEVPTAFLGTCFLSQEKLQVNLICALNVIVLNICNLIV